ncbi:hypothetical protein SEA_PHONEGINGI_24 [Microbacterium phage Phonegingi]|nr:hypothetical protein SEA_PHONEGINGI_24 [Microbacterium phage Phonegingi]
MTYGTVAVIRRDYELSNRVAACVAVEGLSKQPEQWAAEHAWEIAAQPGWAANWESALVSHESDPEYQPGRAEDVITDAMILAAVQSIEQSAEAARAAAESVA